MDIGSVSSLVGFWVPTFRAKMAKYTRNRHSASVVESLSARRRPTNDKITVITISIVFTLTEYISLKGNDRGAEVPVVRTRLTCEFLTDNVYAYAASLFRTSEAKIKREIPK